MPQTQFPSDVTVIAVQKPTLVTVNWNPDPPPPPTVASSTLRTSFTRYPAPFKDMFETVAIPVLFEFRVYWNPDPPEPTPRSSSSISRTSPS